MCTRIFRIAGVTITGASLILAISCSKATTGGVADRASKPTTVRETFDQLRAWHQAGAYTAMRPYIAAEGRESLVDLLVAVDQLVAANAGCLAAARQASPGMDLRPYDLSSVQDNLDLFSRRVDWVSVEENGNMAVVAAEVSGRLPLAKIQFERQAGQWVYVPGPENPVVIATIRQLARSLKQIELVAVNRKQSDRQIDEEYRIRILPKIRKVSAQGS